MRSLNLWVRGQYRLLDYATHSTSGWIYSNNSAGRFIWQQEVWKEVNKGDKMGCGSLKLWLMSNEE